MRTNEEIAREAAAKLPIHGDRIGEDEDISRSIILAALNEAAAQRAQMVDTELATTKEELNRVTAERDKLSARVIRWQKFAVPLSIEVRDLRQQLSTKGGDEVCAAPVEKPAGSTAPSMDSKSASNAAPDTSEPSGERQACEHGYFHTSFPCAHCELTTAQARIAELEKELSRRGETSPMGTVATLRGKVAEVLKQRDVALAEVAELKLEITVTKEQITWWERSCDSLRAQLEEARSEIERWKREFDNLLETLGKQCAAKDEALTGALAEIDASTLAEGVFFGPDHGVIEKIKCALSPDAGKQFVRRGPMEAFFKRFAPLNRAILSRFELDVITAAEQELAKDPQ